MTVEEEGLALGVTERTARRYWRFARAWLHDRLRPEGESLLDRHRPQPGQKDLRGWEWRYLWDQSRSDAEFDLCQRSSEIHSLAASQNGRWLAVGETHRGGVEVWDLPARRVWARLSEDGERSLTAFSPIAPLLAYTSFRVSGAGERKSTLHLWNVESQGEEFAASLDGECVGLQFSSDGGRLVTSTSFQNVNTSSKVEGQVTVWRVLGRGGLETQVQHGSLHCGIEVASTDFAATRELDRVAYGTADGHIRVLDLESGRQVWTPLKPRVFWVNALAFSPDGKTLAPAADYKNTAIDLWDVETQRQIGRLEGHAAHVTALEFTPDGGRLISASAGGWDRLRAPRVARLERHRLHTTSSSGPAIRSGGSRSCRASRR